MLELWKIDIDLIFRISIGFKQNHTHAIHRDVQLVSNDIGRRKK